MGVNHYITPFSTKLFILPLIKALLLQVYLLKLLKDGLEEYLFNRLLANIPCMKTSTKYYQVINTTIHASGKIETEKMVRFKI
jgi:hypothetical protein